MDVEGLIADLSPELPSMEPDWFLLNREWGQSHPEVFEHKYHPVFLDGFACLGNHNEDDMELDDFPEKPVRKRSFIEKMDLAELSEEPNSWNMEKLFQDDEIRMRSLWRIENEYFQQTVPHTDSFFADSATVDSEKSTRRLWTVEEEQFLNSALELYSSKSQIPDEVWQRLSGILKRSTCSIRNKVKRMRSKNEPVERVSKGRRPRMVELIQGAIKTLPNQQGTKDQIVQTMMSLYPELGSKGTWVRTTKQLLSTSFGKIPIAYTLKPNCPAITDTQASTMNEYILWALQGSKPITLAELKLRIQQKFGQWLNVNIGSDSSLQTWEKTLLKKLKNCPYVQATHSQPLFYIRQICQIIRDYLENVFVFLKNGRLAFDFEGGQGVYA